MNRERNKVDCCQSQGQSQGYIGPETEVLNQKNIKVLLIVANLLSSISILLRPLLAYHSTRARFLLTSVCCCVVLWSAVYYCVLLCATPDYYSTTLLSLYHHSTTTLPHATKPPRILSTPTFDCCF